MTPNEESGQRQDVHCTQMSRIQVRRPGQPPIDPLRLKASRIQKISNLTARDYMYNLPYKFKNQPSEPTLKFTRFLACMMLENGRIRLVRLSAVIITYFH
jgi:hypothetical protein